MQPITEPLPAASECTPNRVRWTRAQCAAMQEAGILTGRYELIDGEIISKTGQKPPHAYVVNLFMAWLSYVCVRPAGGTSEHRKGTLPQQATS